MFGLLSFFYPLEDLIRSQIQSNSILVPAGALDMHNDSILLEGNIQGEKILGRASEISPKRHFQDMGINRSKNRKC